jgi:hypothetical protein
LFANLAIHAWLGAFLTYAFLTKYPGHVLLISGIGIVVAALKEFVYDHNWEIPPQPYKNGFQDFSGYMIGGALGLLTYFL